MVDLYQDSLWFLALAGWLLVAVSPEPIWATGSPRYRSIWRRLGAGALAASSALYLLFYLRTDHYVLPLVDVFAGILNCLALSALVVGVRGAGPRLRLTVLALLTALAALWPSLWLELGLLARLERNDFLPWGILRAALSASAALLLGFEIWRGQRGRLWKSLNVALGVTLVGGVAVSEWLALQRTREAAQEAKIRLRSLAFSIDGELAQRLPLDSGIHASSEYKSLRASLLRMRKANPDIAYLYLVTLVDGRLAYPVSGATAYHAIENGRRIIVNEPTEPLEFGQAPSPEFAAAFLAGAEPPLEITHDPGYGPLVNVYTTLGPKPVAGAPLLALDYHLHDFLGSVILLRRVTQGLTLAALGLLVLYRKVEERNQAVEEGQLARHRAEERDRARNEILGMASHEMQSPLHALLAHVQELPAGPNRRAMEEQLDDLQRLVEDLLQGAALQSVNFRLYRHPVELGHLASEASRAARRAAEQKGLTFRHDLNPAEGCWLLTDSLRVRQVIVNLLSNAVKYTPAGTVHLSVAALPGQDPAEGRLRIEVSDTGEGLPASVAAALGSPFVRAAETAGRVSGTGLGLSVAAALCRHLGGTLEATRLPQRGTRFTAELPVAFTSAEASPAAIHSRSLLLVEDHPTIRSHLQQQLSDSTWDVRVAATLAEARAHLEIRIPDAILVDQNLPDGLGSDLVRSCRSTRSGNHPWLIGMSASRAPELVAEMEAAGVDDFLFKPISSEALHSALLQCPSGKDEPSEVAGTARQRNEAPPSELQEALDFARQGNWEAALSKAHYSLNTVLVANYSVAWQELCRATEDACRSRDLGRLSTLLSQLPPSQ